MLRRNPNDAELLYIYGRGKDVLNEHDIAMRAYQAAYNINPYINPDLAKRLGLQPTAVAITPNTGAQPLLPAAVPGQKPGVPAQPLAAPPAQSLAAPPAGTLTPTGQAAPGQAAAPGGAPFLPTTAATPPPAVSPNAALLQVVQAKLNGGNLDSAKKDLMQLLERDPKDGKAWYLLGLVQERKNELDDASVDFRQGSYLLQNDVDCAASLKRVQAARSAPFINEAEKNLRENNLPAARESFNQAISVSPDDIGIHNKLLDVLKKLGDQKEIDRETRTLEKLTNPPPAPPPKAASQKASAK
jgi:tetratricopeptide (TPR) repeat protein